MDEKKKIGILTFHNAHNYGAVLQAYALKTKLNPILRDYTEKAFMLIFGREIFCHQDGARYFTKWVRTSMD